MTLDPAAALAGFTMAGLLGLGVGTINCVLFGLFPTWRHFWNVLTKPLFVVSGVLLHRGIGAGRHAATSCW